ncbi:hypothetical protein [Ruminococcus albus]|uniref:Uncharacterized protein n=1 Tax=Ruminococcus albus TaxID=1264 RepID=A0A1H7IE54_RUMAL|nr:hypothetical protein [Ruminococcus albus]SEK60739.1 hypothetical protein SAMN05216469_103354 [Ruminococcus albus]
MSKKRKITCAVILVLLTAAVIAFFALTTKAERKFGVSIPKESTHEVMGFVYDVRSDLIINIPEDYIRELSESRPTYEEVVEKLGEPSGNTGSGICRAYWRIGERKYAEYFFLGDASSLEIFEFK